MDEISDVLLLMSQLSMKMLRFSMFRAGEFLLIISVQRMGFNISMIIKNI